MENKIKLTLLNGRGYVFNLNDYMKLRKEHHIVGALVGTCGKRGWAANECTLPVQLTHYETLLLLEKGIAVLVSKKEALLRAPTNEELQAYKSKFEARIAEQAESLKAAKMRDAERNIERIIAGKRRKLLSAGVPQKDINIEAASVLAEIAGNIQFDAKNALLDIPYAYGEPHTGKIVKWSTDTSLKYRVFCDFWQRGKFVTAGDSFGADLLVYPGDPMLYHASHIVILLDQPMLQPLNLVAKVRLAVNVNKNCIFAYFVENDSENYAGSKVHYQTIAWEGNREKQKLS